MVNLAKTMPVMQASMKTPVTLWTHISRTAELHWVVVALPPYLAISVCQSSHSMGNQDQAVSPDGVLGLHTEEEGGGEVLDVLHADDVVHIPLTVRLEVT